MLPWIGMLKGYGLGSVIIVFVVVLVGRLRCTCEADTKPKMELFKWP